MVFVGRRMVDESLVEIPGMAQDCPWDGQPVPQPLNDIVPICERFTILLPHSSVPQSSVIHIFTYLAGSCVCLHVLCAACARGCVLRMD